METQQHRFNEAEVLRELEQLQQAIQAARGERRQALERFESFLRDSKASQTSDRAPAVPAFNVPPVEPLPPRVPAGPRVPAVTKPPLTESAGVLPVQPLPSAAMPRAAEPAAAAATAPAVIATPPAPQVIATPPPVVRSALPVVTPTVPEAIPPAAAVPDRVQTSPLRVAHRKPAPRLGLVVGIGGALLAVVLGYVLTRPSDNPPGPAAQPAQTQPPASSPPAPAAAKPAAPQAPPQTKALRVEFLTDRAVWMRVIVDGQKMAEREFPAGQTLTFDADKAVVVRAGDAGAVRVRVNGTDQGAVGVTGQPRTRAFTTAR